ncbi:MAG: carbohydrate kinase family protein [Gammaproteobacteria bacterium]|nr:carbohydrate kinase family protein [Gammaproteobacteria bacterium]
MGSERQRLTIIGDISVDVVLGPFSGWPNPGTEALMERSELRAGGSAGNAALAVSYLGGASQLLSGVGNDDIGRWLSAQFQPLGASLEVCDAPTTLSVGLIHTSGERTFLTTRGHLEKISYEGVRSHIAPARHPNAHALLSGVFLTPALRAFYPRLIADLRTLGYRVALDTNWPPQDWSSALRAEVAGWIGACDHVLLNELEVRSLTGSDDLAAAVAGIAAMLRPGATLVAKLGPRGAVATQDGRQCECAAPEATIFDTIGAGDSFNVGYLAARIAGAGLAEALAAGCRTAAAIISRFPRRSLAPGELGPFELPRPLALAGV